MLKVQILVDNPTSWIIPYAEKLVLLLQQKGCQANLIHEHEEVIKGDILCLLSCERAFKNLTLNRHNLVVHESALPKGKGWSPVTWQVLEGKSTIPVTLFEAIEEIDAGEIYSQLFIELNGHELLPEIKHQQGEKTIQLILDFIIQYPNIKGVPQKGISSFYPRRKRKDNQLDIHKTIEEQFNLLRVCDNERYPAFFIRNDRKYIIKIYHGVE
ncbi:MAG: methionyl-tRNA formyltransferase [Candidatus Brocadia sp. WS118]|nr:MAG: methionyl-tRNA formyltransferase [Candidatus Brocadia sp. WS118]